jgi:predicted lipoprotein
LWQFVVVRLLGAMLVLSLAGCTPWTIRPINGGGDSQGQGQGAVPGKPGFSAKAYIDSMWDSQVLPTAQEKAIDLQTLLTALKADPEKAKQQYGHREGQRPYNFLVKGEAKVLSVDTSSRSGRLKIDLAPGDGQEDAAIQIGPVIRGTSLRDALPFIQFNLFTNQLEYADVSNQLNERVVKDVVGKLDMSSLQGKTVEFQGAFTLSSGGDVLITPVKLQAK